MLISPLLCADYFLKCLDMPALSGELVLSHRMGVKERGGLSFPPPSASREERALTFPGDYVRVLWGWVEESQEPRRAQPKATAVSVRPSHGAGKVWRRLWEMSPIVNILVTLMTSRGTGVNANSSVTLVREEGGGQC